MLSLFIKNDLKRVHKELEFTNALPSLQWYLEENSI